jgi:hypothetical protein
MQLPLSGASLDHLQTSEFQQFTRSVSAGLFTDVSRSTTMIDPDQGPNHEEVQPNVDALEVPADTGDTPVQLSSSAAPPEVQLLSFGVPQGDNTISESLKIKATLSAGLSRYGLTEKELPYYKCKPEQIPSNDRAKLLWDTQIIPGRSVEANRPDLVLFGSIRQEGGNCHYC